MKILKLMAVTMLFAITGTGIVQAHKNSLNDGCGVGTKNKDGKYNGMHKDKNGVCKEGCTSDYKVDSKGQCIKKPKTTTTTPSDKTPATGTSYISNQLDDPITLAFYDTNNAIISGAPTTISGSSTTSSSSIYIPLAAVSLTATAPTEAIDDYGIAKNTSTLAMAPNSATVYGITIDDNNDLIIETCPGGTCA